MKLRQMLGVAVAAMAVVGSQLLVGNASAAPAAHEGGGVHKSSVQTRIDHYLAAHPGEKQIAANKATMPGGDVVFTAGAAGRAAISCAYQHLCIQDGQGKRYDYYRCGYYEFLGIGDGYFNNNQTRGTVARFYNRDGSLRWTSRAPQSGTASWTPVWYIRPC